jgi:hypothetical protein
MQDYILHHTERVDKFKLTLWNLVQWDSAGIKVYIPDNGRVEAFEIDDPDECGSLGRIQDWCVKPTSGKSLLKHSLQGQIGTYKYRRRKPLAKLYKLVEARDCPDYPTYFNECTCRPWSQYVRAFVEKRRVEREFWFSLGLIQTLPTILLIKKS